MGNRLTKIYTRTGDDGTTGMADGSRLSKADTRFEAMGTVDRLNAQIGLLRAFLAQNSTHMLDFPPLDNALSGIQNQLFNVGGQLAMPEFAAITAKDIITLETQMDDWNSELSALKDFILPQGSQVVCQTHIARCGCRDAERILVALHRRDNNVAKLSLAYINRLSDWLFVLARILTKQDPDAATLPETLWQKNSN